MPNVDLNVSVLAEDEDRTVCTDFPVLGCGAGSQRTISGWQARQRHFFFQIKDFRKNIALFFADTYSINNWNNDYLFSTNSSEDDQILVRRYAESTIASDISKIMDSLVQKNFVNYLLNQREKRSEYVGGSFSCCSFVIAFFWKWPKCKMNAIISCLSWRPSVMPKDAEPNSCKDLLKKEFAMWLHSKVDGSN